MRAGAKGLLAPLSGWETHVSVGTSHLAGFVRAIIRGCKARFAPMGDKDECLLRALGRQDLRFSRCINDVRSWRAFP